MTTTENIQTCTYLARKDEPENWHGESPDDWLLDEDSWSCPHAVLDHEELENGEFCVFHTDPTDLPEDVDEAAAFVQAVEAVNEGDDAGKRRKQEFVGATFGAFELERGTVLRSSGGSPIRLDHAVFAEGINADGVVVRDEGISFAGAEFVDGASFIDAMFAVTGRVSFECAAFTGTGEVSFEDAEFAGDGDVWFARTEFTGDGDVWFVDTGFTGRGRVMFHLTEFSNGDVLFVDARFVGAGMVSFANADFSGADRVMFAEAEFTGDGDVKFYDAEFVGAGTVSFRNAEFTERIVLEKADFPKGMSFADVNFSRCSLVTPSMGGLDLRRADFTGMQLRGMDFCDATLEQAIFSRANLYDADFSGAKLDGAIFGDAQINPKTDFGEDSGYRVLYDPEYDSESEFDGISLGRRFTRAVGQYLPRRPSWGDGIDDEEERENRLRKAARAYHTLERIGRENSLPELQTSGFVRRQEMNRLRHAEKASVAETGAWLHWSRWLRATTARATLLYGESPWRVLAASLCVILLAGMLYPLGGFRAADADPGEVLQASSFAEWLALLPDGIYFSTLTFTTLGFGDYQPTGWGKLLATSETALGVTLLALLVFVLGRRAAR